MQRRVPSVVLTPMWLSIPLIACLLCSAAVLVLWIIAIIKIVRTRWALPTGADGVAIARRTPPSGTVCVVVPAHNEAGSIAKLIGSLRLQRLPDGLEMRVVLALDRCTDDTERVAREAIDGDEQFEIVTISACPDAWAGKVHAVWRGVTSSDGAHDADYLLFTDADCWFHADGVAATVALLEDRSLDLLSLFSTLTHDRWFELLAQPAAAFELARQYPLIRANEPDASRRRAFANGQFLLFRAEAYRAIGGHEAVKGALLEDIDLARLIAQNKLGGGLLLAGGVVRCRMYDDWAQFSRGWKRIFTESANRKSGRLRAHGRQLRLFGAVLPALVLVGLVLGWFVHPGDQPLRAIGLVLPGIALVAQLIGFAMVCALASIPPWIVPFGPIGAWLVGGILGQAAKDLDTGEPTRWGGREYGRDRR